MSPFRRKLRKLRRNPRAFFRDMSAKRIEKPNVVRNAMTYANPNKRWRGRYKFVVISAVYNVEKYLDAYFRSIVRQSLDFKRNIKIVLVDDGSEDSSAEIIKKWANKYPDNIYYLGKENGGQASARNVGIDFVEGRLFDADFVTFIDPDDFVELSYFQTVDEYVARNRRKHILMVGCNHILFSEKNRRFQDQHPLRYRFKGGDRMVRISNFGLDLQLSSSTAFFDFGVIVQNELRFHENIRPSFEDAHFVARFIACSAEGHAAFLKNARYFNRKREDVSSTLDQSTKDKGLYLDVLRHGCLDLIEFYKEKGLNIPLHVQRQILYHTCNYISWNSLIDRPERVEFLSDDEKADFLDCLDLIFDNIETDTIMKFELAGIWFFHKLGMLGCFKKEKCPVQIVYFEKYDPVRDQLQVRFFCNDFGLEQFSIDGKDVSPAFSKTMPHDFLDRKFVIERRVWLSLSGFSDESVISVRVGSSATQTLLAVGKVQFEHPIKLGDVRKQLVLTSPTPAEMSNTNGLWIFMDRETQADDNAEHLYRYVRKKAPDRPLAFVLRSDSPDWSRLEGEGFDLLAYGSQAHEQALKSSQGIVSSHVDRHVVDYFRDGSLESKLFVFLQHGVTKDDLSRWLNMKKIDCFVTTSHAEYDAIVSNSTRYKFSKKEVVLTGFPRHDKLIEKSKICEEKKAILVMPTWRQYLAGGVIDGNSRCINKGFKDSLFCRRWSSLLNNDRFEQLASRLGYDILFYPHSNLLPYIEYLSIPGHIEVAINNNGNFQDLLCRSALILTDYSSVCFDMALLKRPSVYYQFDRDQLFNGGHSYQRGYFDYQSAGFGPVCYNEDYVLESLEDLLGGGARQDTTYISRMDTFFAFRDGKNCERVYEAMLALSDPDALAFDLGAMQDHALSAEKAGRWDLAETRWRTVLAHIDENAPEHIKDFAQHRMVYSLAMQGGGLLDDLRAGMQSFDGGSAQIIDLRQQKQPSNGAAESRKWSL